jgi:hypothetical protein
MDEKAIGSDSISCSIELEGVSLSLEAGLQNLQQLLAAKDDIQVTHSTLSLRCQFMLQMQCNGRFGLFHHGLMDRGLFYRPNRSANAAVQSRRRRRRPIRSQFMGTHRCPLAQSFSPNLA